MGEVKLATVKGTLTAAQEISSDQLDTLAHVYGGVKLSLDDTGEILAEIDTEGLMMSSVSVDGCYSDAKETVEEKFNTTVNNTGEIYQRILDSAVRDILVANMSDDAHVNGNILASKFEALTSIGTWFKDKTTIVNFDELKNSGIKEIGEYGFYGCSSLKSIKLPDTVTVLRKCAFQNCTNAKIELDDNITTIYGYAFNGCKNLGFNRLPSKLKTCNQAWTWKDAYLDELIVDDLLQWHKIEFDRSEYVTNPIQVVSGNGLKYNGEWVTEIDLNDIDPEHTLTGLYGSHCGNSKLTKFVCHDGITTLKATFGGCINLEELTLPSNLTTIGWSTFTYCVKLTTMNLPDTVTSIGASCFQGMTKLKYFFFPPLVTYIDGQIFYNCASLKLIDCHKNIKSTGSLPFRGMGAIVVMHPTTPPTMLHYSNGWLNSYPKAIYVPSDSLDDYKTASMWTYAADAGVIKSIGGDEWVEAMKTLAEAEGLSTTDVSSWYKGSLTSDWFTDEYINYDIYGVDRPTE